MLIFLASKKTMFSLNEIKETVIETMAPMIRLFLPYSSRLIRFLGYTNI